MHVCVSGQKFTQVPHASPITSKRRKFGGSTGAALLLLSLSRANPIILGMPTGISLINSSRMICLSCLLVIFMTQYLLPTTYLRCPKVSEVTRNFPGSFCHHRALHQHRDQTFYSLARSCANPSTSGNDILRHLDLPLGVYLERAPRARDAPNGAWRGTF